MTRWVPRLYLPETISEVREFPSEKCENNFPKLKTSGMITMPSLGSVRPSYLGTSSDQNLGILMSSLFLVNIKKFLKSSMTTISIILGSYRYVSRNLN